MGTLSFKVTMHVNCDDYVNGITSTLMLKNSWM